MPLWENCNETLMSCDVIGYFSFYIVAVVHINVLLLGVRVEKTNDSQYEVRMH